MFSATIINPTYDVLKSILIHAVINFFSVMKVGFWAFFSHITKNLVSLILSWPNIVI